MAAQIILIIEFNGERAIKKASVIDGMESLKQAIVSKWDHLSGANYRVVYNVGKHTNCVLKDDDDFENMMIMCNVAGEQCVDLVVKQQVDLVVNVDKPNVKCRMRPELGFKTNPTNPVLGTSDQLFRTFQNNSLGRNEGNSGESESLLEECFSFCSVVGDGNSQAAVSPANKELGVSAAFRKANNGQVDAFRPPAYEMCPDIEPQKLLSAGWEDIIEGVGQVFRKGRAEFRDQLAKYATKRGFQYVFEKNTTRYVNVKCKSEPKYNCRWFIRGTEIGDTGKFMIKKAHLEHDCIGTLITNQTKRIGPKMWSNLVLDTVRKRPTHPGWEMVDYIKTLYGFDVSYQKARRSIESARSSIFGSFIKSYDQLRWYCEAATLHNPGSVCYVRKDPNTNRFTNAFFSFRACLDGFKSCRPILFIDSTFMHGRTQACIFSAVAKDGNNGLFPVAFAITTGETLDNWTWFLQEIKDVVTHPLEICYVTDRNAGLLSAFNVVWDNKPNNFFCLYHLRTNLKSWYSGSWGTEFREKMCSLLTDCVYAPNIRVFNEKVDIFLKAGGPLAKSFLETIPYEKWAVAHSPNVLRYGEMTSNAAESFNSWILVARSLPVTYMVDTIRRDVMRWFVERRAEARKWNSLLCSNRQDLWNHHVDLSRTWVVNEAPNGKYEVLSKTSVVVDMAERSCSCSQWQIHGFPCAHAAAVIVKTCSTITEAVEQYFLVESYIKCYSGNLNPIPDTARFECKANCDADEILPPVKKKQPGRPTKKRKKSYGEVPRKKPTACPSCGKLSRHDPITCLNSRAVDMHVDSITTPP